MVGSRFMVYKKIWPSLNAIIAIYGIKQGMEKLNIDKKKKIPGESLGCS
jgi:hypothetical protein